MPICIDCKTDVAESVINTDGRCAVCYRKIHAEHRTMHIRAIGAIRVVEAKIECSCGNTTELDIQAAPSRPEVFICRCGQWGVAHFDDIRERLKVILAQDKEQAELIAKHIEFGLPLSVKE